MNIPWLSRIAAAGRSASGSAADAAGTLGGKATKATASGTPMGNELNAARGFARRHKTGLLVGGTAAGAYGVRSTVLSNRHKRRQGRVGPQSSLVGNTAVNGLTAHSLGGSTYASR